MSKGLPGACAPERLTSSELTRKQQAVGLHSCPPLTRVAGVAASTGSHKRAIMMKAHAGQLGKHRYDLPPLVKIPRKPQNAFAIVHRHHLRLCRDVSVDGSCVTPPQLSALKHFLVFHGSAGRLGTFSAGFPLCLPGGFTELESKKPEAGKGETLHPPELQSPDKGTHCVPNAS